MNVSIFFSLSVIDFLISPALDTAHDGAAFFGYSGGGGGGRELFSKYFQIPGLISV